WQKAKAASRFADFAPFLQRNLDLRRELAKCLGYTDRIYDPLLDQFEPGMKTAQVEAIFANVRKEIVPLVHAIGKKANAVDDKFLHQAFAEKKQWDLGIQAVKLMGYEFERGRQDRAPHPFTTTFAVDDVRITTRFLPKFFNAAFFATMHEGGHALYNQGTRAELERTTIGSAASLGVHESQSRMWENMVGRSRAFWKYFMPRAKKIFPRQLQGVSVEKMYRAVNRVQPSLIRVEADEVTYNLHIMLRFELENALLEERVAVNDLPEVWNAKMQEYLGVTPPDDAQGVLQDIHWSYGTFGYFPTYSLGNFFAAQLFDKITRDIPDLEAQFERGNLNVLLAWLRANIHTHGRKFTLDELANKVTGESLQTRSFVAYLKTKFGEIYKV
ncbi:MAG: carboxypeptidase M32, partial [Anaerolineales bacterium]|nr:carboxypeptidase M32 [Anaerolineales bacterium]